jgi:4-amino-4-deoxychorismate lyase
VTSIASAGAGIPGRPSDRRPILAAVTDRVLGVLGVGLTDPTGPVLRADDLGVLRGDGCFESIRVVDADRGRLDRLDPHLTRLARSAARLDLPAPDLTAWRALIGEVLAAWGQPGEAVLRLVLTRGPEGFADAPRPTGYAIMSPVPAHIARHRRDGVRAVTLSRGMPADAAAGAPWLLAGVKTTSYALNMAALRHARSVGADDAIFVSTDGGLLEGPTASVLWAAGGVLHTPPPDPLGILDGTTVRALADRLAAEPSAPAVRTDTGTVADLHAADGVWLVSSIRLVVEVIEIDGVARRAPAELTARLQAAAGL